MTHARSIAAGSALAAAVVMATALVAAAAPSDNIPTGRQPAAGPPG